MATKTKTIPMPTNLATPAPLTSPRREGYDRRSQCLGAVAEIAECVRRGDVVLAAEARRTLDTLCWSPDGYPAYVVDALDAHGLRSTPR